MGSILEKQNKVIVVGLCYTKTTLVYCIVSRVYILVGRSVFELFNEVQTILFYGGQLKTCVTACGAVCTDSCC